MIKPILALSPDGGPDPHAAPHTLFVQKGANVSSAKYRMLRDQAGDKRPYFAYLVARHFN